MKAAVVCANPWNLDLGSAALQRSWLGLNVYSRAMAASLRALFERYRLDCPFDQYSAEMGARHIDQISKNPRIDVEKVRKTRYIHDFDRLADA